MKGILELKTVSTLLPIHKAQLLTYLRLSGISRGPLMNFNSQPLAKGIRRMVLTPLRTEFFAFFAVKWFFWREAALGDTLTRYAAISHFEM